VLTGKQPDAPAAGLGRLPFALAACFALSATTLTTFAIVAPDVVSELGLSYAHTGLITAAYMLGYGLFQLPASFLGIRLGTGRVLVGAAVLMSAAALVPLLVESNAGWVISRLAMGIGGAAVLPLSIHLLTRAMSGPRLVKGLAVFVAGWGAGMTLAMLGGAPLLDASGWRAVMLASAALGVLVIAGLQWSLPAGNRGGEPDAVESVNLAELARELGGNHALNMMGTVNATATALMICVPAWLPLYLTSTFGVSPAETSAGLSVVGIGVTIGGWAGGVLAIPFGWRRIVVAALLVSGLLVAAIPLQPSAFLVIAVAVLIGGIGMFFAAPIQSLFPLVVPGQWTALAAGYYNTIGFVGAFLASLVFGFLVDWSASFAVAWLCLASIAVAGILAALSLRIPGQMHST
jgi:predicted MFS family arabinose efflux permease